MIKYYIAGTPRLDLPGDTFVQAVEDNFRAIAKQAGIGNAAGYALERVTAEYSPAADGKKGGAILTIVSTGSSSSVNYDPANDKPRTTTVEIGGATPADLPAPYEFEINESPKNRNPFDDTYVMSLSDDHKWGIVWGLVDYLAANHCAEKEDRLTGQVMIRFPTMLPWRPAAFQAQVEQRLVQRRPRNHPDVARIMDRIAAIIASMTNPAASVEYGWMVTHASTMIYFDRRGKVTALKHFRDKAGLSQEAVAEAAGISRRQYIRYETGESDLGNAAAKAVDSVASALGVTPDKLLDNGMTKYV